jgi:chloramphenicol-sensitive protein RarD
VQAGIVYATLSYLIWGAFPLYFKALQQVSAGEILLHRMLWSLAFLAAVLAWQGRWAWLREAFSSPRVLARFIASAAVLTINWFTYVWAVNHGHVVDSSLGYFINPLINVMFGYFLLGERLRPAQWTAVALAAAGVAWLTLQAGQLPWIGLVIALSFGTYALLRKTASLGALEGLSLETLLLALPAAVCLAWLAWRGESAFFAPAGTDRLAVTRSLLVAAGPLTALPLLMFAAGARRLSLALLGVLQYVAPTLQLLLGVWLYGEPLAGSKLAGYALVWAALILFTAEGLWRMQRPAAA